MLFYPPYEVSAYSVRTLSRGLLPGDAILVIRGNGLPFSEKAEGSMEPFLASELEDEMRALTTACLALAAVLLPLSSVGLAAPSVYTSYGPFDVVADTTLVEDFEAVVPKNTALPSFTHNGITYAGTQATNPNVWVAGPGYTNFGVPVTTSSVLTSTGPEDFVVDLSAFDYTAIAFDAYLNNLGPVVVEVYGSARRRS